MERNNQAEWPRKPEDIKLLTFKSKRWKRTGLTA